MGKAESKQGWEGVETDPDADETSELAQKHVANDENDPNAILRTPNKNETENTLAFVDPRSPTQEIARTPLELKKTDGDPREPTQGIDRTPLLPSTSANFFFQGDFLDPIKEEGTPNSNDKRVKESMGEAEDIRFASSPQEDLAHSLPSDEDDENVVVALEKFGLTASGKKKKGKAMSQSPRRSSYSALGVSDDGDVEASSSPGRGKRKSLPVVSGKKAWYGKLGQADESEAAGVDDHVISNKVGYHKVGGEEESSALVSVN